MNKKNVRLSKDVVPVEYDIQLKPDLKNFTFDGIETISLSLLKPTKTLTLHSKEIEVDTASIIKGKEKTFAKISYDEKTETVTFTFLKPIPKGKTKLHIVFKGILNDKMRGFYRSKYIHQGEELHMATTQFEATDARRAFPCFDEPAQKAIFHVSLVVPKGKTAISNTLPVVTEEHEAGFEMIKFAPTPKMSTYLLAFIVGDFEFIEGKTKRGVQVRVFTVPGKKHQAGFALDCAIRTLDFYESYFDIRYPLPILDMIAIPDFTAAAMENWGAITYREAVLLIDEEHSSVSTRQWSALVIAHELAHQWFGNLVTMEWWTHLWLNEGFASYIEYLAVDKLFPHWDIWTQFLTNDVGVALRLDSLRHTHPIEIPVHHPAEIGEIFDEVSYSKGASVIRMLAGYIGEQNFRDGLRYYLKKHSYKNTETVHLWEAFEKISKKPVASMMRSWTGKGGYPAIKAEMKNDKLLISQERFLASPASKAKIKTNDLWQVPLVIGNGKKSDTSLLTTKKGIKDLPKDWFKVNIGETGFYRTAYDKTILEKLITPVQEKLLSPRDRLGIIRDLFALSEAGVIPTTDALEFLTAYKNEDNFTVWVEIATGLSRIEQMVANTPLEKKLEQMSLKLFSPIAEKLGWEKKKDEVHGNALLRSLAISRAGRAGDKKVIAEAKKKFIGMKTGMKVNPDIRGAVYSIVATIGGEKEFNEMIRRYKSETLHEERNRIGGALGDFNSPELLQKVPIFALSSDVRLQDTMGIFSSLGANPRGRDIWMKAIKDNWPTFVSRYGDGGHTLGRLLKSISGSAEYKHFKAFKDFFSKNEAPGAKRAVEQVLERMEGNILWCKRDSKAISKFFEKHL